MKHNCQRCLKKLTYDEYCYWEDNGYCSQQCYFEVFPTLQAGPNGIFIVAFERPECFEAVTFLKTIRPEILKSAMLLLCSIEDIHKLEWAIPFDQVYRVICPMYDTYEVVSTQALTKFDHTQFNNWCLAKKLIPTTP